MFVRAKNYELNGNAAILVISPLKSIIEELQEMELWGYPAKDLANNLSNDDIRRCNLAIKEGGLTSCQNAAYYNKVVFICWVDYALEGSAFILSKCYFSRMFHTERSCHTYRLTVVIVIWSAGFAF